MAGSSPADYSSMVLETETAAPGLWHLQAAVSAAAAAAVAPAQGPPPAPATDPAAPAPPPSLRHQLPLRDVAQFPAEQVRRAFPILAADYPDAWKEQVRQLRLHLLNAQMQAESQGGSLSVIGLHTVRHAGPRQDLAANLALALASLEGVRVLLVDAKFQRASLHNGWNTPPAPGLAEASSAAPEALAPCFRKVTGTQLYFLPAGHAQATLVDPINLRGAAALLDRLRAQFDWILIDSPAFESPADAMAVSMLSDGIVLLLEQETDTFADLSEALRHAPPGRLLGSVVL